MRSLPRCSPCCVAANVGAFCLGQDSVKRLVGRLDGGAFARCGSRQAASSWISSVCCGGNEGSRFSKSLQKRRLFTAARSWSMSLAPSSVHIIPLCFMRAATTFLHADSTTPLPIGVVHPLLVLGEVVDLALDVVALLVGVAATGVQFLEFLDDRSDAALPQQAAPALIAGRELLVASP